jgi:hypothetical protein
MGKDRSAEELAALAKLQEIEAAAAELVAVGDALFKHREPPDPALLCQASKGCGLAISRAGARGGLARGTDRRCEKALTSIGRARAHADRAGGVQERRSARGGIEVVRRAGRLTPCVVFCVGSSRKSTRTNRVRSVTELELRQYRALGTQTDAKPTPQSPPPCCAPNTYAGNFVSA